MAEHGFFARELNTGWREWVAEGLPTHSAEHLSGGAIRCTCSLRADLVPTELAEEDAPRLPGP